MTKNLLKLKDLEPEDRARIVRLWSEAEIKSRNQTVEAMIERYYKDYGYDIR